MIATSFWSADGKSISAQKFLENLFGERPNFFKNEEELRKIWSNPITRKERATRAKATIFALLNDKQQEFIEFVLSKYVEGS